MIFAFDAPKVEDIPEIIARMEEMMDDRSIPIRTVMQFSIAVDEIYSNIVYYSGATAATVEFDIGDDEIVLAFRDNGIEYNPTEREAPEKANSIEECRIGGMGIFIVKQFMDHMEYRRIDGANVLVIRKKIG